ncbi:hypothetical protein HMPREF0494_0713 [Limosilactobacillus antri DSM 16041]|uniref:Uncharacterized protein n=1 Tax=Limosilactobacillus antri DSM 16041 TaxID=525309 RepID=C8P5W9_9LACO|nr:hypothetical protein HMPREF0494_0713 [Limosilactobacillus antri DSM 16041]
MYIDAKGVNRFIVISSVSTIILGRRSAARGPGQFEAAQFEIMEMFNNYQGIHAKQRGKAAVYKNRPDKGQLEIMLRARMASRQLWSLHF